MKKRTFRFWIEMLGLASAVACAVAVLIATLGTVGSAATEQPGSGQSGQSAQPAPPPAHTAAPPPTYYEGVITDTHCGAKHSAPLAETAGDCTRICVHAGEKFALVDGDKMYVLEGEPAALKRAAGERVKIAGTLKGNTISVTSVIVP